MAAGSSAPELATALIGVFVAEVIANEFHISLLVRNLFRRVTADEP